MVVYTYCKTCFLVENNDQTIIFGVCMSALLPLKDLKSCRNFQRCISKISQRLDSHYPEMHLLKLSVCFNFFSAFIDCMVACTNYLIYLQVIC